MESPINIHIKKLEHVCNLNQGSKRKLDKGGGRIHNVSDLERRAFLSQFQSPIFSELHHQFLPRVD